MDREQYIENSVADLELAFRSCVAQLHTPGDVCHLVSHMIRLTDENPLFREEYRDKITNLMS